jgi:hypothetical protein
VRWAAGRGKAACAGTIGQSDRSCNGSLNFGKFKIARTYRARTASIMRALIVIFGIVVVLALAGLFLWLALDASSDSALP